MNRRNMMFAIPKVALPVLLAAGPRLALAQQTTTATTTVMPMDVVKHKQMTMQVGTFSKLASEVAQQQAANPKVKEFAGFEVAEQTTIAQVLTDMENPPAPSLDAARAQQLQRLKLASGAAFDQMYLQGQIQGHEELLQIQEAFLQGKRMTGDAAHIAMLARTVIQMHLAMLHDLSNTTHA